MRRLAPFACICALACMLSGCAHKESADAAALAPSPLTDAAAPSSGPLALTAPPIPVDAIAWITPLGNLNPPGHTLPTDHIYFYFANPNIGEAPAAKRVPFSAPGDGTVFAVLGGVGVESKVFVRQSATYSYYLDHLILTVPLSSGSIVTAGQVLGTTGSAYGIDLGVVNNALMLNFVNPSRYGPDTLHADGPLKYFSEPLRSELYAKVQRIGADRDGRIDFDRAGRLVGNWFFGSGSATPLVFTYDTYDPARPLIALSSGPVQGVFGIAPADPDPADVTPASGVVLYTLSRSTTGPPHADMGVSAYLLVETIDDATIRAEMFDASARPAAFTGGARVFSR